ncbi:MAG: hypothetical protein K0U52_08020 [Gammaproteobacteria bacterium]|nr:hypothetical protein [Gammaproteobacteria bacterium]
MGLKIGDSVDFVNPPEDVVLQPSPVLKELVKKGSRTMAVVQYQVRKNPGVSDVVVTRELVCRSQDLKPIECVLQIGDYVIVSPNASRTLVGPGTEGIILGGDGHEYTVSFTMRRFPGEDVDLDRPLMVTQEGVPLGSLNLDDSKSVPYYEDYDEESESEEDAESENENPLANLKTRPMKGTHIQTHHFIGMSTRLPHKTLQGFGQWTQENYDQVLDTQEQVAQALDIYLDQVGQE